MTLVAHRLAPMKPCVHLWQPTGRRVYERDDATTMSYQPLRCYVEYRCAVCGERHQVTAAAAQPGYGYDPG